MDTSQREANDPPHGIPAARLTPGVRWQRDNQFLDDPDVSGLYRKLRRDGSLPIPASQQERPRPAQTERDMDAVLEESSKLYDTLPAWGTTMNAVIRCAAEDGLHVTAEGGRLVLDRPLTNEDVEGPIQEIRAEASQLLATLLQERREVRSYWGDVAEHPLTGQRPALLLLDELREQAAREGFTVEIALDEFAAYARLVS
jgi:hypothetical protein